jgi:MoxR-like ATPase
MEERQVTVEGYTTALPRPFVVLATQNPVELEGTFPLPEAQLDRFLLRVSLGYPTETEELAVLRRFESATPLDEVTAIVGASELIEMSAAVRRVHVDDSVASYVVALARGTRQHEAIELGASPRATLALFHAAQALAALRGRGFVSPDDVKHLVLPVLGHRLILRQQGRLHGTATERILRSVVEATPVPVEPLPGVPAPRA